MAWGGCGLESATLGASGLLTCWAVPHLIFPRVQIRRAFLKLEHDYKAVTEQEKKEVVALGGLHVVGTERHESRRIDNQVRVLAAWPLAVLCTCTRELDTARLHGMAAQHSTAWQGAG